MKEREFDDKLKNINKKVTSNNLLVQNELEELLDKVELKLTKGLTKYLINWYSILEETKYFSLGLSVLQNYLVFISANKYSEYFIGTKEMHSWKSKGTLEEWTKNSSWSNNSFALNLTNSHPSPNIKFNENRLINSNNFFRKVIDFYVSYTLDT